MLPSSNSKAGGSGNSTSTPSWGWSPCPCPCAARRAEPSVATPAAEDDVGHREGDGGRGGGRLADRGVEPSHVDEEDLPVLAHDDGAVPCGECPLPEVPERVGVTKLLAEGVEVGLRRRPARLFLHGQGDQPGRVLEPA